MTTIARRKPTSRYRVVRVFDVEGNRPMWCVVDARIRQWAPGTSPDGYDNEEQAHALCADLRAKERS